MEIEHTAGLARQRDEPADAWIRRLTSHMTHAWQGGHPVLVEAYLEWLPGLKPAADPDALAAVTALVECEAAARGWLHEPSPAGTFARRLRRFDVCPDPLPEQLQPVNATPLFPPYQRIAFLGKGAMGEVHLAIDTVIDREVALKVIARRVLDLWKDDANLPGGMHPVLRFQREAMALGGLSHPAVARLNTCGAFDAATHSPIGVADSLEQLQGGEAPIAVDNATPYLDMEWLPGPSLAVYTSTGTLGTDPNAPAPEETGFFGPFSLLDPRRAAEIVVRIAEGMAHAHGRGVLHRDLKPANIRFDRYGNPVIVDFGMARLPLPPEVADVLGSLVSVFGTLPYIAPETLKSRGAYDERTDVFALGVIFYELLTGQLPFLELDRSAPPKSTRALRREVPHALNAICLRALHLKPDKRYPSMRRLVADLEEALAIPPAAAKATRRAFLTGGTGLVLGGAAVAAATAARKRPEPRRFVSTLQTIVAAAGHLAGRNPRAVTTRFLTTFNLHNHPAASLDELQQLVEAVRSAFETFSVAGTTATLETIPGTSGTLLAVDLAKTPRWDRKSWDGLMTTPPAYPYCVQYDSRPDDRQLNAAAVTLYRSTGTDFPIVRADWFVSALQQTATRAWIARRHRIAPPPIDLASSAVATRYRAEAIDLSRAAAELWLDDDFPLAQVLQVLGDDPALRDLGGLLKAPGLSRTAWETSGPLDSPFRRLVDRLGLGSPLKV